MTEPHSSDDVDRAEADPADFEATQRSKEAAAAVEGMFNTVVRRLLLLTVAIAVVAAPLGYWIAGTRGLWAAGIGVALAALWTLSTAIVMRLTITKSFQLMAGAFLGSWLAKTLLTLGVVLILRPMDFYHAGVLFVTLVVTIVGSLAIESLVVTRANIPYVDLSTRRDQGPTKN